MTTDQRHIYYLEYSEEQQCFHHNNGRHRLYSNGYIPLAYGKGNSIINLSRLVQARLEKRKHSLDEVRDTVFKTLYEHAELLPDCNFIASKNDTHTNSK